ncbi:Fc.00g066850.m01.CDS01 [Cosmosporella sp. VM-42]
MSQLVALQSAQASASSASIADPADIRVETKHDEHYNRSPVEADSPTVGRVVYHSKHNSPLSSPFGPLPSPPGPRSPRPLISSPLSATSNLAYNPNSPSPRSNYFPPRETPSPGRFDQTSNTKTATPQRSQQTSFYSDSSDSGSPEPPSPRLRYPGNPNDSRSVSAPVTSKPVPGSLKSPWLAMAGPVAAAQAESSKIPRNSSIDSAISAISTKTALPNASQDGQQGTPDIANLIKTAGSPEAVIQYLLKEKQSQSQQNSQLWRLVDKQRAMILGLNKDLERALKDKEKYRKKLKEVMSIPAVSKATGAHDGGKTTTLRSGTTIPRVDLDRPKEHVVIAPDSPILDSDSQKNSPIEFTMAPYPITPPADHPNGPHSAVGALLDPAHAMPKPHEHALDKFDHEAEDRAADRARKERSEEQLKEIPFNLSLPPSRSLPSEPPKMPPPKPPTTHLPTVSIVEATPQPDEGLSQFPAPPPRKPPPAPLQLNQDRRPVPAVAIEDEDTDSDYDDILEVDEIVPTVDDRRGRRRTREEDDRQREIIALRELAARSASKKSKNSQPGSPREGVPPVMIAVAPPMQPEPGTASLAGVMRGQKPREILAPLMSPGLPASPRPFGMKGPLNSPPLSPRTVGSFAAPPLSPRPPRQPIPLPPNTPLATPAVATMAMTPDGFPSSRAPNASNTATPGNTENPAHRNSPVERTKIYRGLVTDEYPDLLLPPNALPSIEVKVASSRMKPSRASLMALTQLEEDPVFTLAIISRSDGGELWRVEKDSVSLAKLDGRLKQFNSFTARTPERSLFSGHAPAKLDARRIALEQYMDELLNTPFDTATALEVCKYLSANTLPPNADETGSTADAASEGSGNKIGPDGRPLRSGYLTKKGKNFGGWKARFFVLDGPQVKYFETPGGAHLGTIKLPNAQIGKQSQSNENHSPARGANGEDLDNQFRHAFLILEPKKKDSSSHIKHVLCAESDRERDHWVEALLQWIDYRDPDDPEAPSVNKAIVHDRQVSGGSERQNASKGKKAVAANKPYHHQSDSDTLVGVRYDSTQAGDTPEGAPGRPKTSGGLPDNHSRAIESLTSQANRLISAPKDAQVISDASAWGNRIGLSVPSNDEKKARKRSFFGFGPKTRSSSDGQDSLFGGSEAGSNATPPQNSYQGPVRQAFGAPLAEAVRYSPPTDISVPLPAVVYRCIQYLDAKNAVLEEGIFRLSGSNVVIKGLRERFNVEGDINLVTDPQYYDIHAVASLLKLYLRELPTTILTRDLHLEFLSTTELTDRSEKAAALGELVQRLPQANATLLKYLIAFLIKIINNSDINKMTVRNVGIVFSPTLNIPAPVFAMFLQNYEAIFGIEPEEYELPSPISEPESNGRFPDAPPRFDPPTRPGTAGSTSSPHRQPRKDSMRDLARTTPTPPLLSNPNVRNSPPSVSVSRQGYEPSYPGQPSAPQNTNLRPAYEGGYGTPASYDTHNLHPSSRASGYDKPYQTSHEDLSSASAAYDQSYGGSNRRRESAIFMGGIVGPQHQGSKSRLREETRF